MAPAHQSISLATLLSDLAQAGYRVTPVQDALWRVAWPSGLHVAILATRQLAALARRAAASPGILQSAGEVRA